MRKKYTLDEQYKAYLETYYSSLSKYSVDFTRPLTKGEYIDTRASYIADKIAEGKTVYPSNINRDLVNKAKDYAMTPAQARAYQKGLKEMGIKVKFKTLRENKAIKEQAEEDIKADYEARKEWYIKNKKPVPTKDIALDIGQKYFGSPA